MLFPVIIIHERSVRSVVVINYCGLIL